MAKERRIPNYRKMYPTASEEVIAVLRQGERKLIYHEYDLKVETFVVDEEKKKAYFIPSREDSLERLVGTDIQFQDDSTNVEEIVIKSMIIKKLKENLKLLDSGDYEIITALFYEGKSERDYAQECGISRTTLQYRKYRVLEKLKKDL